MPTDEKIDINDPILQQEMVEGVDTEVDFFADRPLPPDDQNYQVKITLGTKGASANRQKDSAGKRNGAMYINLALDCIIEDPDQPWNGAHLFDNANSCVMGASSRLHGILRAVGHPATGAMKKLDVLRDHALGVVASEPICGVSGLWEAQVKDEEAKNGYRTVKQGMRNFSLIDPERPELGHNPEVEVMNKNEKTGKYDVPSGDFVKAQFRIKKYFPLQ